jgi:PAS domain S-box-containing protein
MLSQVTTFIAEAVDTADALQKVCAELSDFLHVPQAGFAILNPERNSARVIADFHPPDSPSALGVVIPVADNPGMEFVLKNKTALAVADAQTDPILAPVHQIMRQRSVRSILIVPILVEGEVMGTLGFDSFQHQEFSQADIALVQNVAGQVGQALVRKRAEEALRESEKRYRRLIESVTDYIYTVRIEDGHPISTSHGPGCVAVTGYTSEEYDAEPHLWYRMIYEEDRNAVTEQTDKVLSGKAVPPLEHRIIHKDGSIRWVRNTPVRRYDEARRLVAYDGLIADVTERKRAEAEIRKLGQFLDSVIESANVWLNVLDEKGKVVLWNRAAEEISGYSRQEVLGHDKIWKWLYLEEEYRNQVFAKAITIIEEEGIEESAETTIQCKDGRKRIISWNSQRLVDEKGNAMGSVALGRDVTDRKRAEQALRESEQFLQNVFDAIQDGISVLDTDLNVIRTNRWIEEMYAHQMPLAGRKCYKVYQQRQSPCPWCPTLRTVETGEVQTETVPYPSADDPKGWIELSAFPLKDEQGQVMSVIEYVKDITERVRAEEELRESNQRLEGTLAELKATQQQIVQQERLAAVGQLAAGVAHDFNNLLTGIIGFAELVQMDPAVPARVHPELGRIVKQGRQAGHLVQQILDFSRKSMRQPQPLMLAPFLKEGVKFLERTIPETIRIQLEIKAAEPMIQADPTQLQQVLTNLAVNARDAMPGGGELKLRLSSLTLGPGDESPELDIPPGEWVLLSVSDTGTGIPEEVLPHIFEPFFTTRAPKGSGLGLAQVYGIVKQHGGNIEVESQVGEGTTFTICLPALEKTEEAPQEQAREGVPRGQGQTVLLVEDEPMVLEVGQAMLERLGYRVLTAVDGQQALQVYGEHRDEIALVLADVVMPEMGGVALLHVLKAQNPDVRMVLTTGYPLGEEAQKVLDQGIVNWLEKPMSVTRVAQVVSRALRG